MNPFGKTSKPPPSPPKCNYPWALKPTIYRKLLELEAEPGGFFNPVHAGVLRHLLEEQEEVPEKWPLSQRYTKV